MPFESLAETLLRQGVAPRYVRRYAKELRHHLEDLTERERRAGYGAEDAAMRARAWLGDDAELAAAMLEQKGMRALSHRAPWAVFALLPPLVLLAAAFAVVAPLVLIAHMAGLIDGQPLPAPGWFRALAQAVTTTGNLALAPALSAGLVMLAWRQRMGMAWPLMGAVIMALMCVQFSVQFAAPGAQGSQVGISAMMWLLHARDVPGALVLVQTVLTLAPAGWMIFARQNRITI